MRWAMTKDANFCSHDGIFLKNKTKKFLKKLIRLVTYICHGEIVPRNFLLVSDNEPHVSQRAQIM